MIIDWASTIGPARGRNRCTSGSRTTKHRPELRASGLVRESVMASTGMFLIWASDTASTTGGAYSAKLTASSTSRVPMVATCWGEHAADRVKEVARIFEPRQAVGEIGRDGKGSALPDDVEGLRAVDHADGRPQGLAVDIPFQGAECQHGGIGELLQDCGGIVLCSLLEPGTMAADFIPVGGGSLDQAGAEHALHVGEARETECFREADERRRLHTGLPGSLGHGLQSEAVRIRERVLRDPLQVRTQRLEAALEGLPQPVEVSRWIRICHSPLQGIRDPGDRVRRILPAIGAEFNEMRPCANADLADLSRVRCR